LAQWPNQESDIALGTVVSAAPKATDPRLGTRALFASLVENHASRLFQEKKWRESATAFRFARDQYLLALNGQYDNTTGEMQYNEAMAEFNDGHSAEGKKL
jgi:hypothetical protein